MVRLAALSLGIALLLAALMSGIVFSQRRTFPDDIGSLVFEMGQHHYNIYSVSPNDSFRQQTFLFSPDELGAFRVNAIGCSSAGRSILMWQTVLIRLDITPYRLTQIPTWSYDIRELAWSPNGSYIAWSAAEKIFLHRLDGTNEVRQIDSPYIKTSLSWSPDGTQIAYTGYERVNNLYSNMIGIADAATGTSRQIYESMTSLREVAWSPDGSRLAFAMGDGDVDIYTIHPDGSALAQLTQNEGINERPYWSPDGSLLSFSSNRSTGDYALYIMAADGSNPYLIFANPPFDVVNTCWLKNPD